MVQSIYIENSCDGAFIIDNKGIRSMEPVVIKSAVREGNTIKLIAPEHTSFNSVIIHNDDGSLCGSINTSIIEVDGVRYKRDHPGAPYQPEKEMYSQTWNSYDFTEPRLAGLKVTGDSKTVTQIPLADKCEMKVGKSSAVSVNKDHPNSEIVATIDGDGLLMGRGTIGKLLVNINGRGVIRGFHVLDELEIVHSDSCNINVTHAAKCDVTKPNTISGLVNITSRL